MPQHGTLRNNFRHWYDESLLLKAQKMAVRNYPTLGLKKVIRCLPLFPFYLLPISAFAQPVNQAPIFENVRISPQFSPDPMTIRGISGGDVPARSVSDRPETATGPCVGFVDAKPDHTLVLNSFFNYLSVQVESPEDTTLVISGPGGSWCNDDLEGKNPGIAGQWQPGTYGVWVGSYQKDKYVPYVIRLTEVR